jgi:glutamate dehydrogenase
MTRPELAVLVAHAKRALTQALLESPLVDDPATEADLRAYFPAPVVQRFGDLLGEHALRRELVATLAANQAVDSMGATFVSRLVSELGAAPAGVVRALRTAIAVTGADERWTAVEALGATVEPDAQWTLIAGIDWLVEVVTRAYLAAPDSIDDAQAVAAARELFARLGEALPELGSEAWREAHIRHIDALTGKGVPELLARRHAFQPALVHAPDIIAVAAATGREVEAVGRAFLGLESRTPLAWLEQINESRPAGGRMQRWAQQALRDDVLRARRELAERALEESPEADVEQALENFFAARARPLARLERFTRTLTGSDEIDLAGLTLVLRQLRALTEC